MIKDPKLCAPVIFTGHSAFSPWKHSNFDRTSEASADFKWSEPEQSNVKITGLIEEN